MPTFAAAIKTYLSTYLKLKDMRKNLLKGMLVAAALTMGLSTQADTVNATLEHTAGAQWGSNTGASTVDAEKEHYNNDANSAWAGCAYAKFSFDIAASASITKATLTYSVNQGGRSGRDDIIYYMKKDFDLDWATFAGQTGKDLRYTGDRAGKAVEKAPTGGTGERLNLTQDVTESVKAIYAEGQSYIIFQWTGNAGGADLYGKASSNAPTLVIETADASTQTTYTVKFTDGENELKDAATYQGTIGQTVEASDADMADFIAGDKKWTYLGGNDPITLVKEAEQNVITLTFEEVATYNYTVVSDLGTVIAKGQNFDGEKVSVPYPKYIVAYGTELYTRAANDKQYNYTFTLNEDNQTETLTYDLAQRDGADVTDVVYYSEAEDIEGLTAETGGNANIRCSMSKGGYNAGSEPVAVTMLTPGTYRVELQVWGNAGGTMTVACGDFSFGVATEGYIVTKVSEEFTLTADTELTITGGSAGGKCADYLLITGDGSCKDIATAIQSVSTKNNAAEAIYNLQGQRVEKAVKGLYIQNGKKYIAK